MTILDERREALVDRERMLLEKFIEFVKDLGALSEDAELVRRALSDLEDLFLLVIVGEFNSGKSGFINALLGAEISEEGVTPTTSRITVLRHGEEPAEKERREGILERGCPNDFLREVAIVDTPGTNATIRHHKELSRGFVPRSDLVVFVTSAERPPSSSSPPTWRRRRRPPRAPSTTSSTGRSPGGWISPTRHQRRSWTGLSHR